MEDNNIIVSIKGKNKNVSIEISEDVNIYEMMEEIRGLLIAWGYHEDSIKSGCEYILEEYGETIENEIEFTGDVDDDLRNL